jgi:hypothetical protein
MHTKIIFKLVFLLSLLTILTGCTTVNPNTLGISEKQWESYSKQERKTITDGYRQAQKKKKNESSKHTSDKTALQVSISDGTAMMPPYTQRVAYQLVNFQIQAGICNMKVDIYQTGNPQQKVVLNACYQNGILYLDPSLYDPNMALGSIQFQYMPLWKRGFTYPDVNSKGIVKLRHANISVKLLEADDSGK